MSFTGIATAFGTSLARFSHPKTCELFRLFGVSPHPPIPRSAGHPPASKLARLLLAYRNRTGGRCDRNTPTGRASTDSYGWRMDCKTNSQAGKLRFERRMETGRQSQDQGKPQYQPIEKSSGVTPAEKYLGHLCEKTFLSLWSYPGVYRDQGKVNGGQGKEICDLLVVFGEHIIIFSDKHCELGDSGNVTLDWGRWFRKAIKKSAEQAWGAERWIRQNPTRIFLDRECVSPLPIDLPSIGNAKFHLVVVAHGISSRIRERYRGSGSLMIDTSIKGFDMHKEPFCVGDLDQQKTLVHILDDSSLNTLMTPRDTISDFVAYLSKRENLFR